MISAHDAEIIGLIGDGDIIHVDCLDDDVRRQASGAFTEEREAAGGRIPDFEYWAILEEQSGYSPLSRYDVHTYESENFSELEYNLDATELGEQVLDLISAGDFDVNGDMVDVDLEIDVAPWVQMTCDRCHERIE